MVYKNGDKYEGDWAQDVRHGLGTLWLFRDGKYVVRYNGEWRNDQPNVSPLLRLCTHTVLGLQGGGAAPV